MKNLLRCNLIIIVILFLASCQQEQEINTNEISGSVSFSIERVKSSSSTSRTLTEDIPEGSSLKITVATTDATPVITEHTFELIKTNNQWISPILVLTSGDYNLTEFIIYNSESEAIYVTPMLDSDLATEVNEPLPIPFSVEQDIVTTIDAQVVSLQDLTAADAGYMTFDIETINHFFLSVFKHEGSDLTLTDAEAIILQDGDTISSMMLAAEVNRIPTNLNSNEPFTLVVVKSGYAVYSKDFTRTEITENYYNTVPVVLTPALTFTIRAKTTESVVFDFQCPECDITVDLGDGTVESYEDKNYFGIQHDYQEEHDYIVSITGDIDLLHSISFNYGQNVLAINLEHLPELTTFNYIWNGGSSIPPVGTGLILDFSQNPKLAHLDIPYSLNVEEVIFPDSPILESLGFWGNPLMNNIEDTDLLISTLYNSVVINNTHEGFLEWNYNEEDKEFFSDLISLTVISEESQAMISDLESNYGWTVLPY